MKKTVYLAGPITGLDYQGCTEWRDSFSERLDDMSRGQIVGMSPLRGKKYLENTGIIGHGNEKYGILSSGKSIVCRDYYDVRTCDAVVMNLLGAPKVSIGSMFEVAWAYAHSTPLILVIEEDREENIHHHDMLYEMAGYTVNNLDDALFVVGALFSAEPSRQLATV
jgi:nucleoside 2-deoxyribosyltransferase